MTTFGEQMRALMHDRGLSFRALAKLVHYDPGYLSKVANDRKPTSRKLAEILDTALNADGSLLALVPPRAILHAAEATSGHDAHDAADITAIFPTRRRSGPVSPELVGYFRDQLAGHYSADRHLGPIRLIPIAVTQYQMLCEFAETARGHLHHTMWALAAGYAAFIGWLYQDGGDIPRSAHWHNVMLERAHRSLDPQLVGFALHNKAMLHADMGDGPGVLDLARAALVHESALCAKVRILALQQAAHGTSLIGEGGAREECERLLDRAATLTDQVDDPYPWGSAVLTPHYLEVQRATCYVRLDAVEPALTVWGHILSGMPSGAQRDLGVFQARQAQALAAAGQPEQAVEIAARVTALAMETGSTRMRSELHALRTRMRPWAQEQSGVELDALLHGLGGDP